VGDPWSWPNFRHTWCSHKKTSGFKGSGSDVVHNEWNAFAAVVEVGVVLVWWLGGVADAPAICVLCTKCGLKVK